MEYNIYIYIKYYCVAKNTIEQCTTDVNSTEANHLILNNIGKLRLQNLQVGDYR